MILTFAEARRVLAKYAGKAGKCKDSEDVDIFVKEVIQQLLFRGASGNLRKWVFWTTRGTFTAPSDMELPVKMHIDGEAGRVMDKFYEFYTQSTLGDAVPCEEGLAEEINPVYTQFDIPSGNWRLLVVPLCKEDEGAKITFHGNGIDGRHVYMPHEGESRKGEVIPICREKPRYSQARFKEVTGVFKDKTKGYVRVYTFCPETQQRALLAEYKPSDTTPAFRRFRVLALPCDDGCFKVTILGRIRFADNYADNDIIPISNLRALKLMAQQLQAEDNDDVQAASYKNQRIDQTLDNEAYYKRTPEAMLDFEEETSPGAILNVI